jgi:hypothetical protein
MFFRPQKNLQNQIPLTRPAEPVFLYIFLKNFFFLLESRFFLRHILAAARK